MDGLTALNLAVSIITLVDFTAKLISKTNDIRERGCTDDVDNLRTQTTELIALNTGLRARKKRVSSRSSNISAIENAIDEIILGCTRITDEMITILDHLTHLNPGVGKSIVQAIATLLKREKLDALSKRLNVYRQEVGLHIVTLLNAKFDQEAVENANRLQHLEERQKALHEGQKKIIEIITFTQTLVQAASPLHLSDNERQILQNQITDVERNEGRTTIAPQERNENTILAILILDDGTFKTITRPLEPLNPGEDWQKINIETTTSFYGNRDSSLQQIVSVSRFASLARTILDILYFSHFLERAESIVIAHRHTFQWIFSESTNSDSTSNLPQWLESGEGCFWINGKAGSGKSTLMKFIQGGPRTEQALKLWAGGSTLVVASFYFWNSGTEIQRSQEGLLRSILGTVLRQQQHLIPLVFPDLCRSYFAQGSMDRVKLTLSELHEALLMLVRTEMSSLKICLFVDGLDEYEGDSEELCNLLFTLVASPHVKAVVSSRPWNGFQERFGNLPRIRMQDLTMNDIKAFVDDTFRASKAMEELASCDPGAVHALVADITSKASGLFLWVIIVVRSLIRGVINRDTLSDLRRRLEEFPSDLENLYAHMIKSMEPLYRQQASTIFQVVLRSNAIQVYGPVSLLQLSYATQGSLTKAIRAPQKLLAAARRTEICMEMDFRLRSRCCGLLEVAQDTTGIFNGSTSLEANVEFLHKTAVDFLRMDKNWELLHSYIPQGSFVADASLLASCLHEIKVLPKERAIILDSDRVMIDMRHCFTYSRALEIAHKRSYTAVLDQLDVIMKERWAYAEKWKVRASNSAWVSTAGITWPEWVAAEVYPTIFSKLDVPPFLALATYSGCVLYVTDKTLGNSLSNSQRTTLLVQMIAQFFNNHSDDYKLYSAAFEDKFNYVTAIRLLLDQGANPNLIDAHPLLCTNELSSLGTRHLPVWAMANTPWTYFLHNVSVFCTSARGEEGEIETQDPYQTITRATDLLDIFQSFIESDANSSASTPHVARSDNPGTSLSLPPRTVITILDRLNTVVCDPAERVFQVPLQETGLEPFQAKYKQTRDMLKERMDKGRLLTWVKRLISTRPVIEISQESKFLLSFITGIIIALLIARLA